LRKTAVGFKNYKTMSVSIIDSIRAAGIYVNHKTVGKYVAVTTIRWSHENPWGLPSWRNEKGEGGYLVEIK
jgi:hypothetical protein